MALSLTSKTLERVWVSASGYILPPCIEPVVVLITTPASCALYPHSMDKLWAGVVWPGLPCHGGSFGNWGCSYHHAPSMAPFQGTSWGTGGHCPVHSGSGWPSIKQSVDSAWLCPPPGWMSLWPWPSLFPKFPQFCFLPS